MTNNNANMLHRTGLKDVQTTFRLPQSGSATTVLTKTAEPGADARWSYKTFVSKALEGTFTQIMARYVKGGAQDARGSYVIPALRGAR